MQTHGPVYLPPADNSRATVQPPFIYQSVRFVNNSPYWLYYQSAGEGSTSVSTDSYSGFLPPYTRGIIPMVGASFAIMASTVEAFTYNPSISQNVSSQRIIIDFFDIPLDEAVQTIPGITIGTQPVSGYAANSVVVTDSGGNLATDSDATFANTRMTVTDLTVANSPIVDSAVPTQVAYFGASKQIRGEGGLLYDEGSNDLTAAGDVQGATLTATGLQDGNVVYSNGSGTLRGDANIDYDEATQAFTVNGAIKSTDPADGVGYGTGAGGSVTQITSKTTGVTLNKICGTIVTHNAALAAGANVVFLVTNSAVAAGDVVIVNFQDTAASTANAYEVQIAQIVAGGFNIRLTNRAAGSLSEAVTINFAVIKAVSA